MTDTTLITQAEIERWRIAFSQMGLEDGEPPGDFARLLAAAEAALDAPAALARARADERAAFTKLVDDEVNRLITRMKNENDPISGRQALALEIVKAEIGQMEPALGPTPGAIASAAQPAAWLILDEEGDPRWIAQSPEEAEVIAARVDPPRAIHPVYDEPPRSGRQLATLAEAFPATAPTDLRERLVAFLGRIVDPKSWFDRGHDDPPGDEWDGGAPHPAVEAEILLADLRAGI